MRQHRGRSKRSYSWNRLELLNQWVNPSPGAGLWNMSSSLEGFFSGIFKVAACLAIARTHARSLSFGQGLSLLSLQEGKKRQR